MKKFNNLTEVWYDMTGEIIEDLSPFHFQLKLFYKQLPNINYNKNETWKRIIVNNNSTSTKFQIKHQDLQILYTISSLGYDGVFAGANDDFKYKFDATDLKLIGNYENFDRMYYSIFAQSMTNYFYTISKPNVDIITLILTPPHNWKLMFEYLSQSHMYTFLLSEIISTIYRKNIQLSEEQLQHIQRNSWKHSLNQQIMVSCLAKKRIGIDFNMHDKVIHTYVDTDWNTLKEIMTHKELQMYFKYFRNSDISLINNREMFKYVYDSVGVFRNNWELERELYNISSVSNSMLRFFTPEELYNEWEHVDIHLQKNLYFMFRDEYKNDPDWSDVLSKIAHEPEDIV